MFTNVFTKIISLNGLLFDNPWDTSFNFNFQGIIYVRTKDVLPKIPHMLFCNYSIKSDK